MCIHMLVMNTTNNKNVLAIVASIAILTAYIGSGFSTVQAAEFKEYGSISQEDQLYAQDNNGLYYVNTGIAYGIGNGSFEQINEINDNFTINGAIKTFGIHEDTEQFIYEPILANGEYSNVLFMYELNDNNSNNNIFELTSIHTDESGLDISLTQLENNQ